VTDVPSLDVQELSDRVAAMTEKVARLRRFL
jgi:uncharacterized small protein (DUF1192 family)